jgi:hypothetical protein
MLDYYPDKLKNANSMCIAKTLTAMGLSPGQTHPAKTLLLMIKEATEIEDYQYGYPRWSKKQKLKAAEKPIEPGLTNDSWCIYIPEYVGSHLGYDTSIIKDQAFDPSISIHYTDGNEMPELAIKAAAELELTKFKAQKSADDGEMVLVASTGLYYKESIYHRKRRYSGHVAVLAPNPEYWETGKMIVGQVGAKGLKSTGFCDLDYCFPGHIVTPPRFFKLRRL